MFRDGYSVAGERLVHRWIYKMEVGPLESWEVIRHTCDNRWCVEPTHLLKGSQQDNLTDMVIKGRSAKGSKHGMSQLKEEDIKEIFSLKKKGYTQQEIANRFNVDRSNIGYILRRIIWKHVEI